jgi:hypothetical protein
MTRLQQRVAAGGTLATLGGLAAFALADESPNPASSNVPAKQPVEIRTQVIRKTVHRTRRVHIPAPPPPPPAAPPPVRQSAPAPAQPVVVPAATPRVATPPAPARAPKHTLRTRPSPTGGEHGDDEHEHEHEHENGDD